MDELHSIITSHHIKSDSKATNLAPDEPVFLALPELFFDKVLINFKLTRIEILVISYLYRQIYSRPNMARIHGISPILSHEAMCEELCIEAEQLYQALRSLEQLNLLETIRSGQYFIRKYFLKEFDEFYGHGYDDF